MSMLIIQLASLIMFIAFFYVSMKFYKQVKRKSGEYYLGALKVGAWTLPVLRYALPFLLVMYSIAIVSLTVAIFR